VFALLAVRAPHDAATERQVSRNYLDLVRAKLEAMSGQEDAAARLRATFPFAGLNPSFPGSRAWRYYGDQTNE
jgi:hypothetical protein